MLKQVSIYSHCYFNYSTRVGTYIVKLEYNKFEKFIEKTIQNDVETPNRIILLGLLSGVELIKEPCALTLITCTPVGFAKMRSSPNAKLLNTLRELIISKKCIYKTKVIPKESIGIILKMYEKSWLTYEKVKG